MAFHLRDYQSRLVDAVFEKWKAHRSTLIVAATGSGKTVMFAEVIRRNQPGRALVLAHRTELIEQARAKIESIGIPCEIEKADIYAATNLFHATPVVVSSIQTQCSGPKDRRRYTRFKPTDFSLLICDEGHHAAAPTWREVIDYYKQNPQLKILGVTATPDRKDREALGQVFESVAGTYDILDAIQDGYLVDITQQFCSVQGLDYSHIKTTAGDLNEGELAKVMEIEDNAQRICQATLEVMHGLAPQTLSDKRPDEWKNYLSALGVVPRRTIVFAVSVMQSEIYANVLGRALDGVEWVCGATRKEDRAAILTRFAQGQTHCVVNCAVLTEGFDNPAVEVIVMARPTKSRALYAQMVGRSTRPLPGLVDGLSTPVERRSAIAASAKPFCISEGTPILTDRGLVPIERVTNQMLLWDGAEFVTNSGVVFRGKKQVITYAGLTATSRHKVWTQKGWQTLGECAAKQTPIAVAAFGGKKIREVDRCYRRGSEGSEFKENTTTPSRVLLWTKIMERLLNNYLKKSWLPKMWESEAFSKMALRALYGSKIQMHKQKRAEFLPLRGTGYPVPFQKSEPNGLMGSNKPRVAQGANDRPNKQRRTLRAGKLEMVNANHTKQQPARKEINTRVARFPYSPSLRRILRRPFAKIVFTREKLEGNFNQAQTKRPLQRKVKVFDIVNAGPRNRFTAAGLLVSNCRILDFVGNSGKHKLVTCMDILGGKITPAAVALAVKKAQSEGKPVRVLRTMDQAELDLEKQKQEEAERRRRQEAARKKHLLARSRYSMRNVSPFELGDSMNGHTTVKRGGRQFSEKQRNFLRKWVGVDPDKVNYGFGTKLIQQKLAEWDRRKRRI